MDYAKGRVTTGFSYPVVGKYAADGGKVTFSEGIVGSPRGNGGVRLLRKPLPWLASGTHFANSTA